MKGLFSLSLLPLLAAASPVVVDTIHNGAAPILSTSNAKEISDSYIVVFKKHVDSASAAAHHTWVQDFHLQTQRTELRKRSSSSFGSEMFTGLKHTFNIAESLAGYSGHFSEDVIEEIRKHPDVSALISTELSSDLIPAT
jgi:cerevisin